MNKSRTYLRNLSVEERKKIALKVRPKTKSFYQYLYQIGAGRRTPSRDLAAQLQKVTSNKVKTSDFDREALNKISV